MLSISTYMPVEIISGKNCVLTFDRFGVLGKRCTVITGHNMHNRCGAVTDIETALRKNSIEYQVLCEADNNPTPENVISLAAKASSFGSDFIVGAGGGSSMDAAKAAALIASNPGVTPDTVFTYDYKNKPLPSVMVGTTAGTGSEVMASAVLTVPGKIHPIKKSLKTRDTYAVFALCDPQYTYTLPESYTVSTALDSICHALESMYSKKANAFTPVYAQSAMKTVMPALLEYTETKQITSEMRDALYYGSVMAGMALNNGGTSCAHSLGYLLTTMHGIPHGFACAAFIGEFLKRNARIMNICDTLSSLEVSSEEEFSSRVGKMLHEYALLPKLDETQIAGYAAEGYGMQSVNNNRLDLSEEDCAEMYRSVNLL